jgi:hypothetical protein
MKAGSTYYIDEASSRRVLLEALAAVCAILPYLRGAHYRLVLDALEQNIDGDSRRATLH